MHGRTCRFRQIHSSVFFRWGIVAVEAAFAFAFFSLTDVIYTVNRFRCHHCCKEAFRTSERLFIFLHIYIYIYIHMIIWLYLTGIYIYILNNSTAQPHSHYVIVLPCSPNAFRVSILGNQISAPHYHELAEGARLAKKHIWRIYQNRGVDQQKRAMNQTIQWHGDTHYWRHFEIGDLVPVWMTFQLNQSQNI